jgi:hypothetical protein
MAFAGVECSANNSFGRGAAAALFTLIDGKVSARINSGFGKPSLPTGKTGSSFKGSFGALSLLIFDMIISSY